MKDAVLKELQNLTKHEHVALVNRGNAAILLALLKSKGPVLSPKEGGWMTYESFARSLGKEFIHINTKAASIDLEDLKENVKEGAVFIYNSNAAYTVAQDIKQIYQICHNAKCTVVMDVGGSLGTKLCNGSYADIMLGSFGRWKLADLGKGGFISFAQEENYALIKALLKACTFEEDHSNLFHKLKELPKRIKFLQTRSKKIIEDLGEFTVINKEEKYPFVVLVKFANEIERLKIATYCTKNKLEYTQCPREIRVMQDAISIEVKRLTE